MKTNYSPLVQIGNIRQTVRMYLDPAKNGDKDYISSKDYAYVSFKFKQRPEFIEPYQVFVFRSDTVHGVGVILDILPTIKDTDAKPDPEKPSDYTSVNYLMS